MRNYSRIILLCFTALSLAGCKKYLDIKPQDQLLETQLYSSETGIYTVLNNIYLAMADNSLYGGDLTLTSVELMAQQYNTFPNYSEIEDFYQFAVYNYTSNLVIGSMDRIWRGQYKNIISTNLLIKNLDIYKGILTAPHEKIIKGEAYALRAMAHFDLLRLFGPVYATGKANPSIPYYTIATTDPQPILSAEQVMNNILADLKMAGELLAQDPIITLGKQEALKGDGKDFFRFRNLRLNYFAVKALEARAQLYAGNKPKALLAAKEVISAGTYFPWVSPDALFNTGGNPDNIFSTEVLFGIQNPNLYFQFKAYFEHYSAEAKLSRPGLTPAINRWEEVYENFRDNDYRYRTYWTITNDPYNPLTFTRFKDIADASKSWRLMQPLIRMSEMYYIAAESETNPTNAMGYLNTVRNNRGLVDLDPAADLETEIMKEYQKEFYGEGQLFFYYKRKNMDSFPDSGGGQTTNPGYVVPLPLSETIYRK